MPQDDPKKGEPGKPGKNSVGEKGGAGGEGGKGGAGGTGEPKGPGGEGGIGGKGGQGARGIPGPRGPIGETGEPAPIHPWRWRLLTIWIILFTFVIVLAVSQNSSARRALCAQRADLQIRINKTQKLLDQTEGQKLVFGIPRVLLVEGQKQSQVTLDNLKNLDDSWYEIGCEGVK